MTDRVRRICAKMTRNQVSHDAQNRLERQAFGSRSDHLLAFWLARGLVRQHAPPSGDASRVSQRAKQKAGDRERLALVRSPSALTAIICRKSTKRRVYA